MPKSPKEIEKGPQILSSGLTFQGRFHRHGTREHGPKYTPGPYGLRPSESLFRRLLAGLYKHFSKVQDL